MIEFFGAVFFFRSRFFSAHPGHHPTDHPGIILPSLRVSAFDGSSLCHPGIILLVIVLVLDLVVLLYVVFTDG